MLSSYCAFEPEQMSFTCFLRPNRPHHVYLLTLPFPGLNRRPPLPKGGVINMFRSSLRSSYKLDPKKIQKVAVQLKMHSSSFDEQLPKYTGVILLSILAISEITYIRIRRSISYSGPILRLKKPGVLGYISTAIQSPSNTKTGVAAERK